MNPFMVWSQLERRKIISMFPDSHNAEISKSLGRTWRGLTPEERRPFLEEAERLKMLHSREFPQYKYQPRKKNRVGKVLGAKDVQQKLVRKRIRKSRPAGRGRKTVVDSEGAGVEESRRAQEELLDRLLDNSAQADVKQEREEEELNLRDLDTLTELSLMELSQDPQLHCLAFRVRHHFGDEYFPLYCPPYSPLSTVLTSV